MSSSESEHEIKHKKSKKKTESNKKDYQIKP